MSTSRIAIIIGAIILLIILGVVLYFSIGKSVTNISNQQNATHGSLPAAGNQNTGPGGGTGGSKTGGNQSGVGTTGANAKVGVISNELVRDFFIDQRNTVTAIEPNGEIIQVVNGQTNIISSLTVDNIIRTQFSYDGGKLLVSFGDPSNPQTNIFTIASKTWIAMPAGWQSPTWSPSDYHIAYWAPVSAGAGSINIVDTAKTKTTPTQVLVVHAQDLALNWPQKTQLGIISKSTSYTQGFYWNFDLQKSLLIPVVTNTPGLELAVNTAPASGTPFGLLFSSGLNLGGSVQLIDRSGNVMQALKFITLPTKCVFSSISSAAQATSTTSWLYCGVPRDQNSLLSAQLPDAYEEKALLTADDLYRINLITGGIDDLTSSIPQSFDISNVKIVNQNIFFINRYDRKLYTISLSA